MKNEKLIYGIDSIIVVAATIMVILHIPHATSIMITGLVVMIVVQAFHVSQLKKKIKELEKE
jgi:hypothetical protein